MNGLLRIPVKLELAECNSELSSNLFLGSTVATFRVADDERTIWKPLAIRTFPEETIIVAPEEAADQDGYHSYVTYKVREDFANTVAP